MMNFISLLEVMSNALKNVMNRGNLDTNSNICFLGENLFLKALLDFAGRRSDASSCKASVKCEIHTHTKI